MKVYEIGSGQLSLSVIKCIIDENQQLKLAALAIGRIQKCRTYLDDKLSTNEDPIYGINTGFGYLQHVKIDKENLTQYNIIFYCLTPVEPDKKCRCRL